MLNAKSPADVFGCFVRAGDVFIKNKYEFEPTFVKKKSLRTFNKSVERRKTQIFYFCLNLWIEFSFYICNNFLVFKSCSLAYIINVELSLATVLETSTGLPLTRHTLHA